MDPSDHFIGDDTGERTNTELTEPDPLTSDFMAHRPRFLIPGHGGCDDFADGWQSLFHYFLSESDQHRGVENVGTATNEHCSNNEADSVVSGIHCRNTTSAGADAVNSRQQVRSHSFNHGKDELDRFRKQEHNSINHKSSQAASCAALPEGIAEEDEIQSTPGANIDGRQLEPNLGVPTMGLSFSSEKAVYEFYSNYAKVSGFNVRRGKTTYLGSDKSVVKTKCFLCSCEGHKSQQIDKPTLYKRQDTRTGCNAMIKCTVNDETWEISKVVLEHNHDLKRCLAGIQGRAESSDATTSFSMGKIAYEVVTAKEQGFASDVNYGDVSQGTCKSCSVPTSDDTRDLIDYFKNMLIEDPCFFYTVQKQATEGPMNFFWRDGRSRVDYMHFGDVLVLDTRTVRVSKSDIICAAYWGLNHHRQRIIFGCALLLNQTVWSLNWLLRSFLEAMNWQKPRTIITDVSEEISTALNIVLPETYHCLSPWSILDSFSKYQSPLIAKVDRSRHDDLFRECVFHVSSQEEFESKWNSFIGKSKPYEEMWLDSLYRTREKWSHAFTKNVFSAGLLSIENNETIRAVFGNLFCEMMTLYQIALRCGEAAENLRVEELKEDGQCEKAMENLKSRSPVEKEADRLYTPTIFRMFQEELINSLSLAIEEREGTATLCKFKLIEEGSTKIEAVEFDPSSLKLTCSCGKFESVGILCFHALKVLNYKNIFKIPARYLLKRWSKFAKDSLPRNVSNVRIAHDENPEKSFYMEFMQKALHVAHICATKKRKRIALKSICLTLENIAKAPRTEVVEDSDGKEDMGQTIPDDALETRLDQENVDRITGQ